MTGALVIVESAAKCKIIEKYLNSATDLKGPFTVLASFGHIHSLPDKELGINTDTWTVAYVQDQKKVATIKKLQNAARTASIVYLASDMDLEGNAIAAHLKSALGLKRVGYDYHRVTFNEITKPALVAAFSHPTDIDYNSVQAQETRRILDRIVGYQLSPLLWRNFPGRSGLSAGRVQSAALGMISDRCSQYSNHMCEEKWCATGSFKGSNGTVFKASLQETFKSESEARAFIAKISSLDKVWQIEFVKKDTQKNPPPPFTTSTLQQECYSKLRISAKKTMEIAQQLYESGVITYMRTDSVSLSKQAQSSIIQYLKNTFAEDFLRARQYTNKDSAQEAHEAIRPTDPSKLREDLTGPVKKVYELIRKRAIASQMSAAIYASVTYVITHRESSYIFKGTSETLRFEGYLKLYGSKQLKELKDNTECNNVRIKSVIIETEYTQPPCLFNESSIIKAMEKGGIGRPSTYVSIIDKLFAKMYIEKRKADSSVRTGLRITSLFTKASTETTQESIEICIGDKSSDSVLVTPLGIDIIQFLRGVVPDLIDISFTSKLEDKLDEISVAKATKSDVLNNFYTGFRAAVASKESIRTMEVQGPTSNIIKSFGSIHIVNSKYGVAMLNTNTSKYTNLQVFLEWRKITAMDISERDIAFLMSLPIAVSATKSIAFGRYGLYIQDGKKNIRLDKKKWNQIYDGDLAV